MRIHSKMLISLCRGITMITVHDLKKIIYRQNGKNLKYGDYILCLKKNTIECIITHLDKPLVHISGSGTCLNFFLQDEKDSSRITYEKGALLKPDDPIVKLYDVFYAHESMAEVILAFMTLEEFL